MRSNAQMQKKARTLMVRILLETKRACENQTFSIAVRSVEAISTPRLLLSLFILIIAFIRTSSNPFAPKEDQHTSVLMTLQLKQYSMYRVLQWIVPYNHKGLENIENIAIRGVSCAIVHSLS